MLVSYTICHSTLKSFALFRLLCKNKCFIFQKWFSLLVKIMNPLIKRGNSIPSTKNVNLCSVFLFYFEDIFDVLKIIAWFFL